MESYNENAVNGFLISRAEYNVILHALQNAFFDAQEKMHDAKDTAKAYFDRADLTEDSAEQERFENMGRNFQSLYEVFEDYARKFEKVQEDLEERDAEIYVRAMFD